MTPNKRASRSRPSHLASRLHFVAAAASVALTGCVHHVYEHTTPLGAHERPSLRHPLKAVVSLGGDDRTNSTMLALLKDSGYFSELKAGPSTDADIVIRYNGLRCGYEESLSFGYVTVHFWVSVATVGLFPLGSLRTTRCVVDQSFELTEYGKYGKYGSRTFEAEYEYNSDSYITAVGHPIYTSSAREKYQEDYLLDQAVESLLMKIAEAVR